MHASLKMLKPTLALLALGAALPAAAQQPPPDAGQVQRENQQPKLQAPKAPLTIPIQAPVESATVSGGAQVLVKRVEFTGNTLFSSERLQTLVQPYLGRSLDLAGLREMTHQISEHYRQAGYVFSKAYLLPQAISDGVVGVGVLEGRFGELRAEGDPVLAPKAQAYLATLEPGSVIEVKRLERSLLILSDLPGISVTPLIRPGQATGTGDLIATVNRNSTWKAQLGLDNHGDRYTGKNRLSGSFQYDSPFTLGDQLSASFIRSDEQLTQGGLGYSRPLGLSGLRGQLSYAHTAYQLAREFKDLDASGTANILAANLSFPLLRTTAANLSLSFGLQYKGLHDKQAVAGLDDRKSSRAGTLSFQFDRSDASGNGVTYGSFGFTHGQLKLPEGLAAQDWHSGVKAAGGFNKATLDVHRLQSLATGPLSVMARVSAQVSDRNLDSSEKFSLGGPSGLRAYPVGEGIGDQGALVQLELRYSVKAFTPYVFADGGLVQFNAKRASLLLPPALNHRSLAGVGAGLRYGDGAWSVDALLARSSRGGDSQSDPSSSATRVWFTINRQL